MKLPQLIWFYIRKVDTFLPSDFSTKCNNIMIKTYESGHSISYKISCAPSENTDQPAHPRNLIRIFAGLSGNLGVAKYSKRLQADSED